MNREHTPGPWEAEEQDNSLWITGRDRTANVICDIVERMSVLDEGTNTHTPCLQDEYFANARLIAASPDLLDACIYAIEAYESDGFENMDVRDQMIYKLCKAAVEKAI